MCTVTSALFSVSHLPPLILKFCSHLVLPHINRWTCIYNQCLCTNFGMHKQYPEFAQLADEALDFCQLSSDDVCNDFENHKIRLTQPGYNYFIQTLSNTLVWGTRAESGEIVRAHDHWPSVWGWTYYIDPPEGCSNLYFPTLDYELEIEHGMLVAFRGHIIHETRSQQFDGYRYCVAGTLSHLK